MFGLGLDNLGTQKEKATFLLYNGRTFETLNSKKRKQKKKEEKTEKTKETN